MYHTVAQTPGTAGRGAHVGIARPGFTAGGRGFEEESERTLAELGVRGHRCHEIEQAIAPDRHEPTLFGARRRMGEKFSV